jgi:hypothetical protein
MSADAFTQAHAEIEAILQKYDLAGLVILSTQERANYNVHLSPSWSCITFEGQRLRFNTLDKPPEQRPQFALASTGLVMGLIDTTRHCHGQLEGVARMLGQHLQISHISRLDPPHENQN